MIAPKSSDLYGANGRRLTAFEYKASVASDNRKAPPKQTRHEDMVLDSKKRKKLVSNGWDQMRNFAIVSWAIRKHISYVSQFHLKIRTRDEELSGMLEREFARRMKKNRFDGAGRHGFHRSWALFECSKVVAGDALMVKIQGGRIQLIESSLIAKPDRGKGGKPLPKRVNDRVSEHGLILNRVGAVQQYCLCRYADDGKTLEYDRLINAENVIYDGYFMRVSQTRGVSPLSAALDSFKDLEESLSWTLAKIKVASLLGFAFMRDAEDGDGFATVGSGDVDIDSEGAQFDDPGYALDLKGNILNLDLEPGDRVDMLESRTPHTDTTAFWHTVIRVALLALDIPYSFFDGRESSFSHTKADRAEYARSCKEKQANNREGIEEWRNWQMELILAERPDIAALVAANYKDSLEDLLDDIMVIATGVPWIDRKDENEAAAMAISQGIGSRQEFLKEQGKDFFKIASDLAEEEAFLEANDVTIAIGQPGSNILGEEETQNGG